MLRDRRDHDRLFVAYLADELVGGIYVSTAEADEPEVRKNLGIVPLLKHFEVRDGFRNRGIGTALMVHAESFLREKDKVHVALGVDEDNEAAIRLYERLEYRRWNFGLIRTFREVCDVDGSIQCVEDKCDIFVKRLAGGSQGDTPDLLTRSGAPRSETGDAVPATALSS